jgi:hypothetical protein
VGGGPHAKLPQSGPSSCISEISLSLSSQIGHMALQKSRFLESFWLHSLEGLPTSGHRKKLPTAAAMREYLPIDLTCSICSSLIAVSCTHWWPVQQSLSKLLSLMLTCDYVRYIDPYHAWDACSDDFRYGVWMIRTSPSPLNRYYVFTKFNKYAVYILLL